MLKDQLSTTNGCQDNSDVEGSPELEQLKTMNQKLKYQKTMLERTLKEEKDR